MLITAGKTENAPETRHLERPPRVRFPEDSTRFSTAISEMLKQAKPQCGSA